MKKKELFKQMSIDVLGTTVFIKCTNAFFSYTPAKDILKDEFKDQYRYFGGLQCNYDSNSEEYKRLENWLCEIAENILKTIKELK